MKLTRSYKLALYPNKNKAETMRYTANRYGLYLQSATTQLFYNQHLKYFSTVGLGNLVSYAQKEARGIIKALQESEKITNHKVQPPILKQISCPGIIHTTNATTSFDYWISVSNLFTKGNIRQIPAKSHKSLNKKLRNGWVLSKHCKVVLIKNRWYVYVYVSKEKPKAIKQSSLLGIDVGIRHSVARSDNYLGKSLNNIIKEETQSRSERQRQKHSRKATKTKIKQQLDIEVNRALARCRAYSQSLVVEHPKVLANLRNGKLHGWARSYFSRRATIKAEEEGVWITYVNPAYTSITCFNCGNIDKKSRVKEWFSCSCCGYIDHSDLNASRNIALKGQGKIVKSNKSLVK